MDWYRIFLTACKRNLILWKWCNAVVGNAKWNNERGVLQIIFRPIFGLAEHFSHGVIMITACDNGQHERRDHGTSDSKFSFFYIISSWSHVNIRMFTWLRVGSMHVNLCLGLLLSDFWIINSALYDFYSFKTHTRHKIIDELINEWIWEVKCKRLCCNCANALHVNVKSMYLFIYLTLKGFIGNQCINIKQIK